MYQMCRHGVQDGEQCDLCELFVRVNDLECKVLKFNNQQQSKCKIASAHIKKWFDAKGIAVTDMECDELAAQLHTLL